MALDPKDWPAPPVEWVPVFDDRREILGYLDARLADRKHPFFQLHVAEGGKLTSVGTAEDMISEMSARVNVHAIMFAWHRVCSRRAVAPMHAVDCLAVSWDKAHLLQNLKGFVYFAEHHGKEVDMSQHLSLMERKDRARRILAAAGRDGAEIVEVTPKQGSLRARDVQLLIDAGEAEWVVPCTIARLKSMGGSA